MTGRLHSVSLVEQAITAMRAEIASGAWEVGRRIPTEPELAEQFGIGRNSLREAVRALVHAGLLETRQGDGTYVRATSDLVGVLRIWTKRQRLIEMLEVRRALEVAVSRLAAERRTEAEASELERVLEERVAAWDLDDGHALFVELDVRLHTLVAEASHNSMLAELYRDFATALRETVETAICETPDDEDSHDALVRAIRARDADAAEAATVQTLDGLAAALGHEPSA
ncbi:MAG TPA: FCD domain-containing protein [Conexibacter sp.]|jgi:DNA-binding FadR family transcriptional regulator